MRSLLMSFVLLAACELEPAPKKAPPPAPTPPPNPPSEVARPNPPAPTPAPAPGDAGVVQLPADAAMEVKQDCVDLASHLAEILIAEQKDPSQKAAIEQEKTRMIRRVAEACTRDSWKPETIACFMKTTTSAEMDVCAKDLTAQKGD